MIEVNTITKLPPACTWWVFTKIVAIFLVISLFFAIPFHGAWFNMFLVFMIIFGLPLWAYMVAVIKNTSFSVIETAITINTGIITKHSNSIPLTQVQNMVSKSGPIDSMFGLSRLHIWTASPSQVSVQRGTSTTSPAGNLVLKKEDAEWLKKYITENRA
jgi:membrane protein YdbS with pleckstrin-like domain